MEILIRLYSGIRIIYTESDSPEIAHECLADFINECIISWTLSDYNYDGSDREVTSEE